MTSTSHLIQSQEGYIGIGREEGLAPFTYLK
jgi:hypothetical protein